MYCIIPRSTVSRIQPVSPFSADHVVVNSLHSINYNLTMEYSFGSRRTSMPNYRLHIDRLQVLFQSPSIMTFNSSPISLNHSLQVYLQTNLISTSKLARSRPQSASQCSHNYCLVKHFSWKEEGRSWTLCHSLHHIRYGIRVSERFWLKQCSERVREYEGIPDHDEPHKLHWSLIARQCVRK